jgi:hypothetical protein
MGIAISTLVFAVSTYFFAIAAHAFARATGTRIFKSDSLILKPFTTLPLGS